ncbi:MAG: sulfurtransferase [Burkholderiaceae bacterium]|nr:sulfurtransferase [Burkholderiaceae bacterium]
MSELLISVAELSGVIDTPDLFVFDVRHELSDHAAGRVAYQQGHIPGALFLDHETQLAAPKTGLNGRHPLPDITAFAGLLRALGLTPQSRVVVYDAGNGAFAAHLWWMLRWAGYRHVQVLDGGWQAWLAASGDVQVGAGPDMAQLAASIPQAVQPAMPSVDARAVLANLEKPRFTVLDARDAARFRGEVEPMDPVAGHIPGAINRPIGLNMQADGHFKPAALLHQEFTALLQGKSPESIVHQCGSGITACHNLFAMELAGLNGSSLYPGSWSEWCSDPTRPVALGSD